MPIYDYKCRDCGHEFLALVKSDPSSAELVCPKCDMHGVERLQFAETHSGCSCEGDQSSTIPSSAYF